MAKDKKGRGPKPTNITVMKLVANAGGRCQFSGCNKQLFIDSITMEDLNNTNVAHIVASSLDGPRGNEESFKLSDKLENLMLLCQEHHKLIDERPNEYTVEILKEMKNSQEEEVKKLLDEMHYPETKVVVFESPIKNKIKAKVDFKKACEAIRESEKKSDSRYPLTINLECEEYDYNSNEFWKSIEGKLERIFSKKIEEVYIDYPSSILSIFPIAPIPLIAKFGNLLGDKKTIDIYQKTREPDTWKWLSKEKTNDFKVKKEKIGNGKKVAIVLSLTAEINFERITSVLEDIGIIYHLKAERNSVDCIKSLEDLKNFGQKFLSICDEIKNTDKEEEVFLFPAIPVSAAFEIGRRHMRGAHPIIHIYDENNGFIKTITIGG